MTKLATLFRLARKQRMGARTAVSIQGHTPSGLLPPVQLHLLKLPTFSQPIESIDGLINHWVRVPLIHCSQRHRLQTPQGGDFREDLRYKPQ